MVLTGENRRARRKHLPLLLCVSQIASGLARGASRISTVRGGPEVKSKINPNYCYRFSPYRAVNTLRLVYKNPSVNAVWGNNRSLF